MSDGRSLKGQGEDLLAIEQYLVEEVLRRVRLVEECERKIDGYERQLRAQVDKQYPNALPGLSKTDLYRRAYKDDKDWNDQSGTLKWHMALCDMYSGAAAAVQGRLRRILRPQ